MLPPGAQRPVAWFPPVVVDLPVEVVGAAGRNPPFGLSHRGDGPRDAARDGDDLLEGGQERGARVESGGRGLGQGTGRGEEHRVAYPTRAGSDHPLAKAGEDVGVVALRDDEATAVEHDV